MVNNTKFEEAKSSWSKLEKACDDRINKLNNFSVTVVQNLKQAEEEFILLNQALQEL